MAANTNVKVTQKTEAEKKVDKFDRIRLKKQATVRTNFPQTERMLHQAERVDRILNDLLELGIRRELVREEKYATLFALDNNIDVLANVITALRKKIKRTATVHGDKTIHGQPRTLFLTWTQTAEMCTLAMQVDYLLSDLKVLTGNRTLTMNEYYQHQKDLDSAIETFHTTIGDIRKTVRTTGRRRSRGRKGKIDAQTIKTKTPAKTAEQFKPGSAAAMVAKRRTTTPVDKEKAVKETTPAEKPKTPTKAKRAVAE